MNPQNKIYPNAQVRAKVNSARHYERRKALKNVCLGCGEARDLDGKTCSTCLATANRIYRKRLKDGVCGRCGKYRLQTKTRCGFCADHGKQSRRELKREIIRVYGGECACCGITTFEFLSLEHTKKDGGAHRKEIKKFGNFYYLWLKRQGFPQDLGLAILCMNCNFSKGKYGYCPHETKS